VFEHLNSDSTAAKGIANDAAVKLWKLANLTGQQ